MNPVRKALRSLTNDELARIIALRKLLEENPDKVGERQHALIACILLFGYELGQDNANVSDQRMKQMFGDIIVTISAGYVLGSEIVRKEGEEMAEAILKKTTKKGL